MARDSELSGARRRLPLRRKLAFAFVLVVVLPAGILLAAELAVRIVAPAAAARDPFLAFTRPLSILSRVEVDGRPHYEISNPEVYRAHSARFAVEKPADTVRIFALGGSAAAGWPHPPNESYTDYLRALLALALPEKRIEVLNVAGHGYASYRVRMIFDEIVGCDPDLVIVYSGNNEFVEDRSYAVSGVRGLARALASRSRLAALLQSGAQSWLAPATVLPGDQKGQMAWHIWGNLQRVAHALRSDPEQLAQVRAHYAWSMEHIADQARARGIPVLFLTVPVNLRDWQPHVSAHAAAGTALDAWRTSHDRGRRRLLEGDAAGARAALEEAAQLDPEHADTRFWLGRACERAGDHPAALRAYRAAKDLDRNPFRALSAFNETLRALAARDPNAALLDLEQLFDEAAAAAAPGFDLFLDYVHPTKDGNVRIAHAVLRAVLATGIGGGDPAEADARARAAADAWVTTPYRDQDDLMMQWMRMQLSAMMHQYETYVALADTLLPRAEAGDVAIAPDLIRKFRDAFARYLDQERRELLGQPFDPDYRAAHERFYRESLVEAFAHK